MLSKSERALLDIREAILRIRRYTDGMTYEQFRDDEKTFDAVTRRLEIISEASRRLDEDVRGRHPDLPWREVRDAGNVYRHEYDNVAEAYIWGTITKRLEPMLAAVDIERGAGRPSPSITATSPRPPRPPTR